jgi:hypothetical protein
MNLFRSEEHVKRWSLYEHVAEDYVMPVADWARVFSGPLFRNRMAPDFLERSQEYLAEYHNSLKEVGKTSPFWQYPVIEAMTEIRLPRFRVVGNYARFEPQVLNALKDIRNNIVAAFDSPGKRRDNHLLWAAPGTGKSYFVQQIAKSLADVCHYREMNLAKGTEDAFRKGFDEIAAPGDSWLCLIDEVDAQPDSNWPYELMLPYLDEAAGGEFHAVFVMAGSSGYSLEGMKQKIAARPKGSDFLSRIPMENQYAIPAMTFGDRVLVVLSQFVQAGIETGRDIRAVEKLGLYYIALNSRLTNARQLYEFAVRAVERVPRGDDRVKYDHLFSPGDPENKRFWLEVSSVAKGLINSYVDVEH